MTARQVVICNPVRTAIGTYNGSLKDVPATDRGATVIRETLKRSGLAADQNQSVVIGNVIQAGNKMNAARQAGIGAGLPVNIPAMTVNRVCGSGAQGVASAALEVWSGMIDWFKDKLVEEKMVDPEDIKLIQLIDEPEQVVEAIFKHYESRPFGPLPSEREMLLNL